MVGEVVEEVVVEATAVVIFGLGFCFEFVDFCSLSLDPKNKKHN